MSDSTTPQDSAAMSPASAGSQPVAFAVMQPDSYSVFASRALAEKMRLMCAGGDIVPLYRQPQPTLTDEEREAVEGMVSDYQEIAEFNEERCHPHYAKKARRRAAMLIGLLERLG